MNTIQIEACKLALRRMMDEGFFSICVVNDILKLTGGVPTKEDYQTLQLLHCVKFRDMPPALRVEFPGLLRRVLESPSMELEITFKALARPPALLGAN